MTTIAFLGLGNMGAPMSANLVGAGHVVRGFDPAPTAASGAAAHGVAVFRSAPEAVAEADVVITMLPTGEVVRRCYTDVPPRVRQRCSSTAPRSRSPMPVRCTRWPNRTACSNWMRRSPAG